MANKLVWLVFGLITCVLFLFFLQYPVHNSGGDIVEYFGMTESLINHGGVNLTSEDYEKLKLSLNPGYFVNPNEVEQNGGFLYYMEGKDGNKYPVHFPLYSLISFPVRILLRIFQLNELLTLRIANLLIFSGMVFIILQRFLKSPYQKAIFLLTLYLSPIISFLIWPGPDIYYLSLLTIGIFLFYEKRYVPAVISLALASWHSQPLMIIAFGTLAYYFFSQIQTPLVNGKGRIDISPSLLVKSSFLFILIILPYLYNYALFGVFTPWTILQDGWTQRYGFGIQNMSLKKLFEQFFDLNAGLFWYAPMLLLFGIYYLFRSAKSYMRDRLVLLITLLTAFFYQTNPAWHYGAAGYGPSRHILFILPFLIYFAVRELKSGVKGQFIILFFVVSQLFTLSMNGFIVPQFENTLFHSPYARYVLDNFPHIYNPTAEIFVDRTNHTDLKILKTAIYKNNGECKKAYVLKTDMNLLEQECGFIPEGYEDKLEGKYSVKPYEGIYVNF